MSTDDGILRARLDGSARRLATDTTVTDAAAVEELRALAAGRSDLPAEAAGVALGFAGDDDTKWAMRRAAELLIEAGANQDQLQHWIVVGQERAARANAVPQTYNRLSGMVVNGLTGTEFLFGMFVLALAMLGAAMIVRSGLTA